MTLQKNLSTVDAKMVLVCLMFQDYKKNYFSNLEYYIVNSFTTPTNLAEIMSRAIGRPYTINQLRRVTQPLILDGYISIENDSGNFDDDLKLTKGYTLRLTEEGIDLARIYLSIIFMSLVVLRLSSVCDAKNPNIERVYGHLLNAEVEIKSLSQSNRIEVMQVHDPLPPQDGSEEDQID